MSTAPITITTDDAAELLAGTTSAKQDRTYTTVIERRTGWRMVNPRELWAYRELLYFLTWRDVKVQYKQTVLGPIWAIIRPVVSLIVFSVIFGKLVNVPSNGFPYPLFAYAGILPWTFFASAVVASTGSLLNHAHLLSKIYFPRILLPTVSIGSGLVTLAINFVIYFLLMAYYGKAPGLAILLLPVLVALTVMIALGVGFLLSGLTIVYRDIRFIITSVVQAWMYLSPVIYPVTLVPDRYQWLLILNPMTGIIGAFRTVLLNQPVDYRSLTVSAIFAVVVFVAGIFVFHATERRVADVA